ncbi:hypothetical protein C8F04DRAFT_1397957 [Mycena alexandri]|uniref:Uncharacterized protein n=1 Tax=Mycena alexandri TaxID=1745969 RepID=A0AAD6SLV3_9AGAR|nr:hypothetical protein C8F04DRAFT_1397957 [Mycena alexandri]
MSPSRASAPLSNGIPGSFIATQALVCSLFRSVMTCALNFVHSHDVNIFPAKSLPRSSFKTETTKIILSFDKRSCAHIPFVHCFTQTPSSVIICCRCNSNSVAASVHPSLSDGRTISTCSAKPYPQSGSIILQFPQDEVRLASSSQAVRVTPPFAFTAGPSFGHCILPSTTCPF